MTPRRALSAPLPLVLFAVQLLGELGELLLPTVGQLVQQSHEEGPEAYDGQTAGEGEGEGEGATPRTETRDTRNELGAALGEHRA